MVLQILKSILQILNFKQNIKEILASKKFYIFFLSRFNSCSRSLHYFPKYNLDVLISQISNQIDFNLELTNKALILNFGLERIIGNHLTDIGDNTDFVWIYL